MQTKERFKLIPAVYLILRDGDKVLLLERANTGYQDGKYGLVAGHLDGDELATEGLVREAKEEAGITLDPRDVRFVHMSHRLNRDQVGQERVDIFFEATTWSGTVTNTEPHKCSDLSWFDRQHLPPNMLPLVRRVLADIDRGIPYSEYPTEPTK